MTSQESKSKVLSQGQRWVKGVVAGEDTRKEKGARGTPAAQATDAIEDPAGRVAPKVEGGLAAGRCWSLLVAADRCCCCCCCCCRRRNCENEHRMKKGERFFVQIKFTFYGGV